MKTLKCEMFYYTKVFACLNMSNIYWQIIFYTEILIDFCTTIWGSVLPPPNQLKPYYVIENVLKWQTFMATT